MSFGVFVLNVGIHLTMSCGDIFIRNKMPVGQTRTNVALRLVMRQSRIESGSKQRLCIFKRFIAQISQRRRFRSVEQFNLFCVFWPLRELLVN